MSKKKVRIHDDIFDFDGHRVHRRTKCGFRASPVEPCIDIGSIWFMLNEVSGDKPYNVEVAKKRGFKYISVAYRGELCDYLVGKLDTCRGLVVDVIEGRKKPRDDREKEGGDPRAAKRRAKKEDHKAPDAAEASQLQLGMVMNTAKEFKATDLNYGDVQNRVRQVKDLDVLVRCPGRIIPNVDLILKIAQDEVSNWHGGRGAGGKKADAARGTKIPLIKELEQMIDRDLKNRPIILVPCNKTSPVNILNVQEFLQDGRYSATTMERTKFFESTRMEYVEIVRNVRGKMWTFEVRDTAKNFTKSQWLRVVAVVTDGSEWQFAGYPFENVVDLFTTCKGVYFREAGALTPLHVREWAVALLEMHPLQFQHRFAEVRDAFWVEVGTFLETHRLKKFSNSTTLDKVRISADKPLPVL